jgi:hypothetical protein
MAHPLKSQTKTGQELAASRYTFPASNPTPDSLVAKEAKVESRGEKAADNFVGAPARQVSETGKVRK